MKSENMRGASGNPKRLVLENETLRVLLLPEVGFKIASVFYKPRSFEAVFQPSNPEGKPLDEMYRTAFPGASFEHYDTSGIDDCIPTIDAAWLEECQVELNDHGDTWSASWVVAEDAGEDETAAEASVQLASLPLRLTRRVSLEENVVRLSYELLNTGSVRVPWMWTLHDLLRYEPDAQLDLPQPFIVTDVQRGETWDFDIRRMDEVPENATYKFYYDHPVKDGVASIRYPSQGMLTRLLYDGARFPYLGVWMTTGGFKNERNIALEPSNGFYDSLPRALSNQTGEWLDPGEVTRWSVRLAFQESEVWDD